MLQHQVIGNRTETEMRHVAKAYLPVHFPAVLYRTRTAPHARTLSQLPQRQSWQQRARHGMPRSPTQTRTQPMPELRQTQKRLRH